MVILGSHQSLMLVLLGETEERNEGLKRGSHRIAYDLRETLTEQKHKEFQIAVVPPEKPTAETSTTLRANTFPSP